MDFVDPVPSGDVRPDQIAVMDQNWAMASEHLDVLLALLAQHKRVCTSHQPCVDLDVAEAFNALLQSGPVYTMCVLHVALDRLTAPSTSNGVAKQEGTPCPPHTPEPKEPE
jgi:hypothetical protein